MIDRPERSALTTPGSNWRMIEKALASPADVVIIDLEDAVAPGQKVAARGQVIRALRELDWGRKPRLFRINALDTPWFYRDLIEIVEQAGDALDLIVVPKVNRPEDVHVLDTLLAQLELAGDLPRRIGLEVQIETAPGLVSCEAIAAASPRIEAVVFGPGDYAAAAGIPLTAIGAPDSWDQVYPGHRFHYPMHRLLVAGRAAGTRVIDGPFAAIRDEAGLHRSCLMARALGYDGKWAIHPSQLPVINEVFSPSVEEVLWATKVIAEYESATYSGNGAIALDGVMLDAASIRMARSTLARTAVNAPERQR
ncbi:MAG: CoA ester lyase [Chloroflexia bacterium]|nr:CoA ester lyase [Chloroflexia bacterium]